MNLIFLPGAFGAAGFWRPVGDALPETWNKTYLSWPGLGAEPAREDVSGFDGLVRIVESELHGPSVLIAHSIGGVVAVRAALRHPEMVSRLVLTATSGGVDVASFGASDWRATYFANFPTAATWITEPPDLTSEFRQLQQPTLLIWGDADPVSPVAVGEHLESLIPSVELHIVEGGDHGLAMTHAGDVARLVRQHLDAA